MTITIADKDARGTIEMDRIDYDIWLTNPFANLAPGDIITISDEPSEALP
jgi:hypothetical protein